MTTKTTCSSCGAWLSSGQYHRFDCVLAANAPKTFTSNSTPQTTKCSCGLALCPICRPAPQTTPEREIIDFILKMTEEDKTVKFEPDLGTGSITICVDDDHTHCGYPDCGKETLIKDIASTVGGKGGLLWA